jgi:hypothetical protein
MSDIVDPQATAFCNERVRPFSDLMRTVYLTSKSISMTWNTSGVNAKLPNDSSLVVDGSATDGRTPITGADVNNIINRANDLIAYFESSGISALISPGSTGIRDTAIKPAVNGSALF